MCSTREARFSRENIRERLTMREVMDQLRASGIDTGGPAPYTHRMARPSPANWTASRTPRAARVARLRRRWHSHASVGRLGWRCVRRLLAGRLRSAGESGQTKAGRRPLPASHRRKQIPGTSMAQIERAMAPFACRN